MLKRHEDQIWARLDELYANGTTFLSWAEIYHWYNLDRISKTPWRDLKARWEELLEERKQPKADPQVAEGHAGVSLFYARRVSNLSKLAS